MTKKSKPLPRPAKTPFGKRRGETEAQGQELMADKMAEAAALGKLDEFISRELPDNEHARKLAEMMMGMTGMAPGTSAPLPPPMTNEQTPSTTGPAESAPLSAEVPEEMQAAIQSGDIQGLMGLLRKEHKKRSPDPVQEQTATEQAQTAQDLPTIDKELIDALIAIAQDNSVTLDWIILRAIRVYVQEYKKTGKL